MQKSGMTLIELIVVMALLGIIAGAGVGLLTSLDFGQRAALGTVQNTIRAARNSAVARGAPARVRIDAEASELHAEVFEVIGTWHFEGDLAGARGHRGVNQGVQFVDEGWIGRSISFAGEAGSTVEVPVQSDPSWDFQHGFRLDCVVRLEGGGGGSLVNVGGVFGLELEARGAVTAWFVPALPDATGALRQAGRQVLRSPEGALDAGTWLRLRCEYDRRLARLFVEGVEVARTELDQELWELGGPLILGDSRRRVEAGLDGLVIGAFGDGETVSLGDTVRIVDAPAVIAFDSGGHLDREVHAGPVQFALEFEDGRRAPLLVGAYGTVEAGPVE